MTSGVLPKVKLEQLALWQLDNSGLDYFYSFVFLFLLFFSRINWAQPQETKLLVKELVLLCFVIMVISGSRFAHLSNGFWMRLRLWHVFAYMCICVIKKAERFKYNLRFVYFQKWFEDFIILKSPRIRKLYGIKAEIGDHIERKSFIYHRKCKVVLTKVSTKFSSELPGSKEKGRTGWVTVFT